MIIIVIIIITSQKQVCPEYVQLHRCWLVSCVNKAKLNYPYTTYCQGNMLAKFGLDLPPEGGVGSPKVDRWAQIGLGQMSGLWPNGSTISFISSRPVFLGRGICVKMSPQSHS